jgi:hypothetical protein
MFNFFECVELASVRHRLMTEMTGTSSSPCGYPFPTTVQSRILQSPRLRVFVVVVVVNRVATRVANRVAT